MGEIMDYPVTPLLTKDQKKQIKILNNNKDVSREKASVGNLARLKHIVQREIVTFNNNIKSFEFEGTLHSMRGMLFQWMVL